MESAPGYLPKLHFFMLENEDRITLLNQVNFILLIKAFRFIILSPPSQYCFTTTFCLIFAGPSHKKEKNILFSSLIICSDGFGIEINK